MKITVGQLRRIIAEETQKVVSEASLDGVDTSAMAVVLDDSGTSRTAVVYDVPALRAAVAASNYAGSRDYIIGFVQVAAPRGAPCRGAWQVKGIVGPGKIVYGLAYALSPTGLIVPDRSNVSPSASSAWKGYAAKVGRANILPLDDADHPKKGADAFHDAHHTPSEDDDCYTSHEEEYLNAAYRGPGGEGALLDRLMDAHESVMNQLAASGVDASDVEGEILDGGYAKFDASMGY